MLEAYGNRILAGVICAFSGWMLGASVFWINGGPPPVGALLGGIVGFAWGYTRPVQDVVLAGLAFAIAQFSALLIVCIFMRPIAPQQDWLKNWVPLGASGWICGSLLGSLILSSPRLRKGWQATLFGACVGFISCWVFFCLVDYADRQPSPGWDWILIMMICLAWASMLPSALAGYLLFKLRERQDEQHYQRTRLHKPDPTSDQTLKIDPNTTRKWEVNHDQPEKEPEE